MPYAPDAPASKAKVAGVVMFYMVSALVVRRVLLYLHKLPGLTLLTVVCNERLR